MSDKLSDQWRTPQRLFDELNAEFNFDIDLCATSENSKCTYYCEDYLRGLIKDKTFKNSSYGSLSYCFDSIVKKVMHGYEPFEINTAFLNPPYSNPRPFIEKAWEDSKHCKIVCLVKCDPSTRWWATFWNYVEVDLENGLWESEGPKPGCEVRFFPRRIKFDPPRGYNIPCRYPLCYLGWIPEFDGSFRLCPNKECVDGVVTKKFSGPTFPCALVIMDRRGRR